MEFLLLSENPNLHSTKRLLDEASSMQLKTSWKNPYHTQVFFDSRCEKVNKTLVAHRTTGIRFDDFDLLYSKNLSQQGAKVFNHPNQIQLYRDKDNQALLFRKIGLDLIPTLTIRGVVPQDFEGSLIQSFGSFLKEDKFIIKMTRGNNGIGVNLIHGISELLSWLETFHALRDQKFIIQPFLDDYEEVRVFVIGNKIIGGIEKARLNSCFKQNLSRTQEGLFLESNQIGPFLTDPTNKIINHCKLDYFALDFLVKENEYYPLEINFVPGFDIFEKISKINLAKAILKNQVETYYEN